ncbi:MAG: hypothetical protein AAFY88_26675, partial [Acidobacteriota bacterium]
AMSNADMELSNNLYLAVLQKGEPSPLAAESDEEEAADGEAEGGNGQDKDGAKDGNEGKVHIDIDGLAQRIVALPVDAGVLTDLAPGQDGQLYYLARNETGPLFFSPPGGLHRFDLKKRSAEKLADGVSAFELSADASKVLLFQRGSWSISDTAKVDTAGGALDIDAIRVQIDPRSEWPQIYDEAWRINRDYFYDPGMHGADWPAMKKKYAQFLPHLTSRDDLNLVIQWLCLSSRWATTGSWGVIAEPTWRESPADSSAPTSPSSRGATASSRSSAA